VADYTYTPSLDEAKGHYAASRVLSPQTYRRAEAEFDRMIAQVRAEAAVQTLRVAAREAEAWRAADGMNGGEWFPSKWAGQVAGWLEHRADTLERAARIEKEQDQ
jgi:hypothetical protein